MSCPFVGVRTVRIARDSDGGQQRGNVEWGVSGTLIALLGYNPPLGVWWLRLQHPVVALAALTDHRLSRCNPSGVSATMEMFKV